MAIGGNSGYLSLILQDYIGKHVENRIAQVRAENTKKKEIN
jgi:hypothetical protein